jgi:hypothetical protein
MARFQREAEVLASLNHPNIAQTYGVEERALAMELVAGEAPNGPMPFDEAWKIGSQIAAALEYAHDKGIIHRDLKPANIKVTPDGTVKLLDFGLAKAFSNQKEPSASPENSPTLTIGATEVGVVLGTAAYMPPEQAKGKSVDKRADIWAFGVVFYELLAGTRPFEGEDVSETLVAVIRDEPDLSKTPPKARRLLQRCLEKDPKKRLRDIGDAMALVEEAPAQASGSQASKRGRWLWPAISAALAIALIAVAVFQLRQPLPAEPVSMEFQIPPPENTQFGPQLALSPDGRLLAFTALSASEGPNSMWVRPLGALQARPLRLARTGMPFFWSPDSRFIAYNGDGKLTKIDVSGGPPQVLCDAPLGVVGGFWTMLFLSRPWVSATGNVARRKTRLKITPSLSWNSTRWRMIRRPSEPWRNQRDRWCRRGSTISSTRSKSCQRANARDSMM